MIEAIVLKLIKYFLSKIGHSQSFFKLEFIQYSEAVGRTCNNCLYGADKLMNSQRSP